MDNLNAYVLALLIVLKVTKVIAWSWWLVTMQLWLPLLILALVVCFNIWKD